MGLHVGVGELLVVEESRVRVNVGVDALVYGKGLRVDLRYVSNDQQRLIREKGW